MTVCQTIDEMKEKIKLLLNNDPEATHNTLKNQEFIKKSHCLINRHKEMLAMMMEGNVQYVY
jgi:hypothetical protein